VGAWADKAAALASYAKQVNDESLLIMARRIKLRAHDRMGELLKAIESQQGGDRRRPNGGHPPIGPTRTAVARDAGLSNGCTGRQTEGGRPPAVEPHNARARSWSVHRADMRGPPSSLPWHPGKYADATIKLIAPCMTPKRCTLGDFSMSIRSLLLLMLCCALAPILAGCAAYQEQPQRIMVPIDAHRFKDGRSQQIAFNASGAKCQARGLQAAASIPAPSPLPPPSQQIFVQNAPIYASGPTPLPAPYIPDANSMIAAHQAGRAAGMQNAIFEATFVACMAEEGWTPQQVTLQR